MKERPILFSAPMVRAVLGGAKTVTRRVAKEAPSWATFADTRDGKSIVDWHSDDVKPNGAGSFYSSQWAFSVCPYGVPGDRLWVRETWACLDAKARPGCRLAYRADTIDGERVRVDAPWKPSIHLPRWASRITLEVVKVSVERLHAITEEEAVREGVDAVSVAEVPRNGTLSRRDDFAQIWEKINGRGSWAKNPWVWRVEFKVVKAVGQ